VEAGGVRIPLCAGAVFEVSPWLAVIGMVCPVAWRSFHVDFLAVSPESVVSVSVHLSEKLVALFKTFLSVLVIRIDDSGDDELAGDVSEIGDRSSQWSDAAWCSSFSIESSAIFVDLWGDEKVPVNAFVNGLLNHSTDLLVHFKITGFILDAIELVVVVSLGEAVVAVELLLKVLFSQNWESVGHEIAFDEGSIVGVEKFIAFALEVSATLLFCRGEGDTCC